MVDIVPAHSAMTVCQASRISGSAAMAEISLCHRVIQSCASLHASGALPAREPVLLNPPASWPAASVSCPVLSKPASITMPHSSSSQAGP
jgi:hypothetical protein